MMSEQKVTNYSAPVIFESPCIKVQENPSSAVDMFHADRRTGRHDEANNLFGEILLPLVKMDKRHCYNSQSSTEYSPEDSTSHP